MGAKAGGQHRWWSYVDEYKWWNDATRARDTLIKSKIESLHLENTNSGL